MTDKLIKEKAAQKVVERDNMRKRWEAARIYNRRMGKLVPDISLDQVGKVFDWIADAIDRNISDSDIGHGIDYIVDEMMFKNNSIKS